MLMSLGSRRLVVMGIGVIAGFAIFCNIKYIKTAKSINGLANIFLIIGVLLIPGGFVVLPVLALQCVLYLGFVNNLPLLCRPD